MRAVEDWPGVTDVSGELTLATPQLEVELDRQKIADLGLSVDTVGRTLESFLAGRTVTRFNRNAEQYDVIVQVADADRKEPDDLSSIYVRGRGGEMIQLSNLVSLRETVAAKELNRYNQLRSATVYAALAPDYCDRRGTGAFRGDRPRDPARRLPLRLFRTVARVQAGRQLDPADLRAGAGLHLSPACGTVRELPVAPC